MPKSFSILSFAANSLPDLPEPTIIIFLLIGENLLIFSRINLIKPTLIKMSAVSDETAKVKMNLLESSIKLNFITNDIMIVNKIA
jgi:hypothetical protein